MELEQRLGERVVTLLQAANTIMDAIVAGAAGSRNIEYTDQPGQIKDDRRVPGYVLVGLLVPRPLRADGVYTEAMRTQFRYSLEFHLKDDKARGLPARRVYQALVQILGNAATFFSGYTDTESNLTSVDGEVEIDPQVRTLQGQGLTRYTAEIGIAVWHKTALTQ